MNIYIAFSFMNYSKEYDNLRRASLENSPKEGERTKNNKEVAINKEKEPNRQIPHATSYEEMLKPKIAAWIKRKRFAKEQFTIEELATYLGTNKTYLSKYIKDNYHVNFSTWVATLRINEAKRLMAEEEDKLLEDIAFGVGFSSLSYFSKVFTKLEGVSPSVWLKNISRSGVITKSRSSIRG